MARESILVPRLRRLRDEKRAMGTRMRIYLVARVLRLPTCPSLPSRVMIGTLRKTRRQRQRERHETKVLMSKTIAVHVRYNSWYISLPSSPKQQHEMRKFCFVNWRTRTTTANVSYFYLELNAFVAYSAGASFNTDKHTK